MVIVWVGPVIAARERDLKSSQYAVLRVFQSRELGATGLLGLM